MHAYTYEPMIIAGSAAVEESSMLVNATGVGGRSLQDPECGRSMRSHCKEIHGISKSIPFVADISMEKATSVCQVLTSLWSGGDNSMPGKQLNPQVQCHIINTSRMEKNLEHLSPDRMKKGMEELRPDWQIDQSIQSRAQFSNTPKE